MDNVSRFGSRSSGLAIIDENNYKFKSHAAIKIALRTEEARRSGVTHEEEIELGKELALYAGDPLKFVMDMFPWDSDPQLKGAAPEQWQRQVLERACRSMGMDAIGSLMTR